MIIQVDVDSTLYDANKLFYEVGTKEFGIDWPKKYYSWFSAEDIGTNLETLKNVFRKCHSKEYVSQQKPYSGAAEELGKIADDFNVEICYVSDRNTQQTAALHDWLRVNGFLFNDHQQVLTTSDKRHWMREKRPEFVIDDRVRTILMARYELGSTVLTLEHPHNMNLKREAEHIYLFQNWNDLGAKLYELVSEITPLSRTKELEIA